MNVRERHETLIDVPLDALLLRIKRGDIKVGKYASSINLKDIAKLGRRIELNGSTREESGYYSKRRKRAEAEYRRKVSD